MDFISQLHKKIEFVDEILNKYMPGEEHILRRFLRP